MRSPPSRPWSGLRGRGSSLSPTGRRCRHTSALVRGCHGYRGVGAKSPGAGIFWERAEGPVRQDGKSGAPRGSFLNSLTSSATGAARLPGGMAIRCLFVACSLLFTRYVNKSNLTAYRATCRAVLPSNTLQIPARGYKNCAILAINGESRPTVELGEGEGYFGLNDLEYALDFRV